MYNKIKKIYWELTDLGYKKYLLKIPIDDFYEKYKDEYEIIFKGYQIAFKKKIS